MAYIIGIDIGTYSSKGVLVRRDGKIIAKASKQHDLLIPREGWAEHDAEKTWWNDLKKMTKSLIKKGKKENNITVENIKCLGISTIAPALVPVDKNREPLRNAILYGIDTRASKEVTHLNKSIGKDKIFKMCGHHLSSQSAGPKILWIKNNEPSIHERTKYFLSGPGYLIYKLTGECVMDIYTAVAFSPLLNINNLNWNKDLFGITTKDKLPQLKWSYQVAGRLSKNSSREIGLKSGTKVITGTADALAESISIGAVNTNDLMIMYGSSTFLIQVLSEQKKSSKMWASVHAVPELNTITGGTATAGSITQWFIKNFGDKHLDKEESFNKFAFLAEESSLGANGLITLPYFSGERTPINNPDARGMFFGLTLKHTRGDLYRSVLEGIGFSINHNIEELKNLSANPNRIVAVGGGINNRLWLQCVSDICNIKQVIPKIKWGASYGDAFLAALGLGWYSNIKEVKDWVDYSFTVKPDQEKNKKYKKLYKIYKDLYKDNVEKMAAIKDRH